MLGYPFVVIEGLDGTGKTTLRKSLFRLWHGLYRVTPLCLLTTNYLETGAGSALIDGKYAPTPTNADAYLDALAEDKRASVERLIRPTLAFRPVIADRWLLSEMTFFALKHGREPKDTYEALAGHINIPADVTFVLEADLNQSMSRTGARQGDSVRDDWDEAGIQQTVKSIYEHVATTADQYPLLGRIIRLDGGLDRASVLRQAWDHMDVLSLTPPLEDLP